MRPAIQTMSHSDYGVTSSVHEKQDVASLYFPYVLGDSFLYFSSIQGSPTSTVPTSTISASMQFQMVVHTMIQKVPTDY